MVEKTTTGIGQDSVSSMVQDMLIGQSVLSSIFWDVTSFGEAGDTSISFPRNTNRFSVQKLTGAQKGSDQELVLDLDQLPLDQEAHIQWVIKKFDQAKSKVAILENAIENATAEHALGLDEDILAALESGIATAAITGGIDQDAIVDAITAANKGRIPRADRSWVFGNDGYGTLLKIDGFVDASKSNLEVVRTGQIGTLYGTPTFESDVYTSTEALLTHKKALCFGFAAGPEVESQQAIEYGTGSKRWVMDQNYGVKILNEGLMAIKITA